jgi:hypothetical protein
VIGAKQTISIRGMPMPLRPDFLPGPVRCGRLTPIPELPLRS